MKLTTMVWQVLVPCFCLVNLAFLQAQSIAINLPQNSSGHYVLDYGKLMEGLEGEEMATQAITIKNNTDSAIDLLTIESDCACLRASLPDNPSISGGGEVSIVIYYNNRRLGPFSKSLKLTTSTGEQAMTIEVVGEVQLRAE